MGKLYIHIGTHKTGSTSVQQFLHKHRKTLKKYGIHYPDVGISEHGHHGLAWACGFGTTHKVDMALLDRSFDEIRTLLEKNEGDVIISSEEFEYVINMEPLAKFATLPEVRILLYVRRQDQMLESMYNQHVAMYGLRYSGSIYQFSQSFNFFSLLNYRAIAMRWGAMFGHRNVYVRPYGAESVHPDIAQDVLWALGSEEALALYEDKQFERKNTSLGAHALRLLAHINRLDLSERQHRKVVSYLRENVPRRPGTSLLRKEDAELFCSRFSIPNALMGKAYLFDESDPFKPLDYDGFEWVNHELVDTREVLELVNELIL